MASGGVAEKKAKKDELEEELKKGDKAEIRSEIVRVGAETAIEEKKEEAESEKAAKPLKSSSEVSAEKPEKGMELEEKSAEMKARDYSSREEFKGEEDRLETKAAELRERQFTEKVRSEEVVREAKQGEKLQKEREKQAPPRGKVRIRRPPTAAEKQAEDEKLNKLAVLRRRDKIRKDLEQTKSRERLAKAKGTAKEKAQLVKGMVSAQAGRLDSLVKKIKEKFKLRWK